jgi:hypothetical protein
MLQVAPATFEFSGPGFLEAFACSINPSTGYLSVTVEFGTNAPSFVTWRLTTQPSDASQPYSDLNYGACLLVPPESATCQVWIIPELVHLRVIKGCQDEQQYVLASKRHQPAVQRPHLRRCPTSELRTTPMDAVALTQLLPADRHSRLLSRRRQPGRGPI